MLRNALDGLTVVDFTQIGAGPTCTMLLADMGARVIKVEVAGRRARPRPRPGLDRRRLARCTTPSTATSSASALNLKSPDAVAVARRLIAGADVVVESMRPGVMAAPRAGLRRIWPRTIRRWSTARSRPMARPGPYADRAGVDGIVQADSGLMSLIGVRWRRAVQGAGAGGRRDDRLRRRRWPCSPSSRSVRATAAAASSTSTC